MDTSADMIPWEPVKCLSEYIKAVFDKGDQVRYRNDIQIEPDGTPLLGKTHTRKASELIESLEKHSKSISATIGERATSNGALIGYNAPGSYDNALIVFMGKSADRYYDAVYDLQLPAVCAVINIFFCALVLRIGAKDINEYKARVEYLDNLLITKGYTTVCARKPNGCVYMPGTRFLAEPVFLAHFEEALMPWEEWKMYADSVNDTLPPVLPLSISLANPPERPEALIDGLLRRGHKMIISGPSKSGKSFLLMALCICLAEGISWLGFPCTKGRVLYVNLEIDTASCYDRFKEIYLALGIPPWHYDDIETWNLRGHAAPLDKLAPMIITRAKARRVSTIVLDPFYKLNNGDENNAGDMARFVNNLDRICTETGAAVIYSHHHSKSSADRRAINRASGSTVFSRDPDAILDLIDLERPQKIKAEDISVSATPLRMSFILREFASPKDINLWFDYPLHRLDTQGDLANASVAGDYQASGKKSKSTKKGAFDDRYDNFVQMFDLLSHNGPVTIDDMAKRLSVHPRTIKNRINGYPEFSYSRGIVTKNAE